MICKKTSLLFDVVHVYSRAGRAPALLPPQLAHVAAALTLPALPSPPPVAASNATRVPDLPAIDRCASACGSAGGRRAGADPGCGGSTSGGGLGGSTSGGCGDGTSELDGMVGISGADVQHRAGSGGGRRHGLL